MKCACEYGMESSQLMSFDLGFETAVWTKIVQRMLRDERQQNDNGLNRTFLARVNKFSSMIICR